MSIMEINEEFITRQAASNVSRIDRNVVTLDFDELHKRKYDMAQFPDEEVQEIYNNLYDTTLSEVEPCIIYNYSSKDPYKEQDAKREIFKLVRNSEEVKSVTGRFNIYQVRELTLPSFDKLRLLIEKNDPWLEHMSEYEIIVPYNFPKKLEYLLTEDQFS